MKVVNEPIHLITKTLAIACLASVLLSWKLWLGERNFPTVPVFNFIPSLTHPLDYILFILLVVSLIGIIFLNYSQKLIISFLIISSILAILDLNRWQPWFYQYVLMFFVLSFYKNENQKYHIAIIICFKLMTASIYFWSGLQKLNPNFIADTFPWVMEPITSKLGEGSIAHFKWLGLIFPLIETATGILLVINKLKKTGAVLAISMHLFILVILGPAAHNYNFVVWPWNIFMIFIIWHLFYKTNNTTKKEFNTTLTFHSIKFVLILFVLMPLFNFFNRWDSYLSHNLYSGNTSNGIVYVSDAVKEKLPNDLKPYLSGNDNQISIKYWCMKELGVPPYPEKRNFETIARTFYKYTKDTSEIYFEFTPKIKVKM